MNKKTVRDIDLKNKKILVKSIAVIGEGVEIGVD
mgnify:CR=1 FL=1